MKIMLPRKMLLFPLALPFLLWPIPASSATAQPFAIIIDPGHGGSDPGANYHQTKEADITLQVGKKLVELLNQDERFRGVITRKSNRNLSLKQRAGIANSAKGNLFISIHTNASTDHRVNGVEFYFQNQLPPDKEAYFLAGRENESGFESDHHLPAVAPRPLSPNPEVAAILDDMLRNKRILHSNQLAKRLYSAWQAYPKKRILSIRQAPFYLISHVEMPSALVELGYLSHREEAKALKDPQIQSEMAESIYAGIVKFKEMLDKQSL